MHIAYLCNEYPPYPHGGIGSFVQLIARHLVQRGHKVSVLGMYPIPYQQKENDQGVEIYRLPAGTKRKLDVFVNHFRLSSLISQVNNIVPISLIEGIESSYGLLSINRSLKKIIRIHGGHHFFSDTLKQTRRLPSTIIERISFSRADYFCAVSQFAAETTRRLLKLDDRPIEILPNPVDVTKFRPFPDIPEQENLIIFTGGLREKKGVRQLVQAMPEIVRTFPTARLWLQGADFIDRETGRSMLETLKSEIPTSVISNIEFRGPVQHEELPRINALAGVLVFPSWMETQGIVVIEGMASGKAVVASQAGPGPELIDDGLNGLLCDPHSPASIAQKVMLLLGDGSLRKKLSQNARRKAVEQFSIDVLINKNIDFYDRCLHT